MSLWMRPIRLDNRTDVNMSLFACDNSNKCIKTIYYLELKGQAFAMQSIGPLPESLGVKHSP